MKNNNISQIYEILHRIICTCKLMTAKFHNYLEGYKKLNYLMNKILLINIIRENNYCNYFITRYYIL